jgi:2-keto-4-pentenoate hydratase
MTKADLQIGQWASRQLADYDTHNPGTVFADGIVLSVSEAYELQAAVAELRLRRGERIVGYKVGCTSPKIRAQLGIDHCVTGRLYESERHASGSVLQRSKYADLAIEGELAVELSHEPTPYDFSGLDVPACVGRIFPVMELHNHVMRGATPTPGELIANNAIHAGFVTGPGIRRKDVLGEPSLAISSGDRLLDACDGAVLTQTIKSSLAWLMEIVRERGARLMAGQIILTGSVPSLIPIREDCCIRVNAPPFGSVEASFI